MGITELFEIGFFSLIWNWSSPLATALVYACILIGAVIQTLLQKKCQKPIVRWLLIGSCGIGVIVCEGVWHFITGWERLGLVFVYGYVLCVMLGAVIAAIILSAKNKRRQGR